MNNLHHLSRSTDLEHHIVQAKRWLEASESGKHTIPLSYASFEIRLAVERICMQYYVKLVGSKNAKMDPGTLSSFKKMKNKIFSLAGYQNEINKQFDVTRLLLKTLNILVDIHTPDLGRLSSIWHDCSEPCHIFWNMSVATEIELSDYDPFLDLTKYAKELSSIVEATTCWLNIHDFDFNKKLEGFDGSAESEAYIREHFEKVGLYAKFVPSDGSKPYLVGTPIQPNMAKPTNNV